MKKKLIALVTIFVLTALHGATRAACEEPQEEKSGSILKTAENAVTKTLETPAKIIKQVLDFTLNPIVVTPWGTEKLTSDISKNVSVVSREDIENSSASTLTELLSTETAITVSELLGNPKGATVDMRGFGEASHSNLLVLIDGRRTNQIDMSGVDWAQIDLNTIESIEIVKGGSSVLYGDNATGGVINIITRKGGTGRPNVTMGASLGSDMYHTEYGTLQYGNDIASCFSSYKHRDQEGYRENSSFKANDWFGRVTLTPFDWLNFASSAGYHKDEYGLPGGLRQPQYNAFGRKATSFPDSWAKTEDFYVTAEPEISFDMENHKITGSVHGTFRRRATEAVDADGTWNWYGVTTTTISSGNIKPKVEVNSNIVDGNVNNALIVGTDHFISTNNIISGDLFAGRNDVDVNKRTCAFYLYDSISFWDRFLFNGGYRYEWVKYKFSQKGQLTDNDKTEINEWACELGGGYKYNPSSQVYINWSRSYRYPATDEYYQSTYIDWTGNVAGGLNRQIQQQVGHNIEVGIKENSLDWLSVNANWFFIDTKQEIYLDPTWIPALNIAPTNTNYSPRTKRYGFEIEGKANAYNSRVMPFANYTFQRSKFEGGAYDENDIPLAPDHRFACGIALVPIKGLTWTSVLNYTGSRYMVSDQRNRMQKMNSYATVDTKLSYNWKNFTLFAAVNNALNRKYNAYGVTNAAGTGISLYPAPRRAYEIGAALKF
ncbi:MAG: TonB-dependent receptor [Candidatus Omnitrophota bacterium]